MRVSTNTIYDLGVNAIQQQQAKMLHTQQQVSSGRRILTPADDPVAAARAIEVSQSASVNARYATNRGAAKDSLSLAEGVLQGVTGVIQDVRELALKAGNPVLTNSDRMSLAVELRGRFQELLGLANSADGTGQYLFSGYQGATQPFAQTPTGAQYAGDDGRRLVQVGASRQMAVSESGSVIFERIRTGNGTFSTAAGSANSGSGIVSPGTVTDPASLTGHSYQIAFRVAGGTTTYDVLDTTLGTPVSSGNAYASGNAISFSGMRLEITGSPADGDTFAIAPSTNQSIFQTLNDLIGALEAPVSGQAASARLSNGLGTALSNLDQGLDNVLGVRAAMGARLKELDSLQSTGEDLALQYQQILSQLQDVDYAAAISQLTRQQTYLEAAQKSFLKVSGLSLFNYV